MRLDYSINYLNKYLEVKVLDDKTVINYWNRDTLTLTHEHAIGMKKINDENFSKFIISDWVNGFIYTLHNISLYDRVPKHIYLYTEKYPSIFESMLKDKKTYSQFYLGEDIDNKNIHVIINKISFSNLNSDHFSDYSQDAKNNLDNLNNKNKKIYERYTKTISQFKF